MRECKYSHLEEVEELIICCLYEQCTYEFYNKYHYRV